jgi:tyrosinase|tara:strand:- start:6439 stop:6729 length:291 start_codon:yes stop_codon:yes gene_type:complete
VLTSYQEQLYKEIQWLAAGASEDRLKQYKTAANEFRMPYWDWAKDVSGGVPDFFTWEYIGVTRPNGSEAAIWNPLYAYYFHPVIPDDFDSKVSRLS